MYRLTGNLAFCLLMLVVAPAAQEPPVDAVIVETVEVQAAGARRQVYHKTVEATFLPQLSSSQPGGWNSRRAAALAFFQAHDEQYLSTTENQEIAGFLLESDTGTFHHTNAVLTPVFFTLKASIGRYAGWRVAGFLHTHPPDEGVQEYFSEFDYEGMKATSRPYYLRTPSGDLRYMDPKNVVKNPVGAAGIPVCPQTSPCLAPHPDAVSVDG